jgi:hypothetical protein
MAQRDAFLQDCSIKECGAEPGVSVTNAVSQHRAARINDENER